MSGFRIGDRVYCEHYGISGRVIDFDLRGRKDSVGETLYEIEWESSARAGRGGWSRTDDLLTLVDEPATSQGQIRPRIRPARTRFTVPMGWTTDPGHGVYRFNR